MVNTIWYLMIKYSVQYNMCDNIHVQLLDEVENDILCYQCPVLCYLPKAEAVLDNTRYHSKTEFNNCFIIQL